MEQTECSEISTYKIQRPGNYPEESIQHSEQGESLKSRKTCVTMLAVTFLYLAPFMTEFYNNWHLRSIPNITVFAKICFVV
jgi:hypothetical protein